MTWRIALRLVAAATVLTAGAVLMLLAALLTLFQARRLYSERIAAPLGKAILAVFGVRYVVHGRDRVPGSQVVYVSNHSSTLDMFVLIALGLPNTRFFLSGYLRKVLPLGLIGYLIGIFWTVDQVHAARRKRIFERAARVLKRTGESVYLSPEGQRVTSGKVGPFNKGAFHLATDLQAPIVPLFIAIPRAIDPGTGLAARPGVVHVHFLAPIDTSGWRIDQVPENRDRVHALFSGWHAELHAA
jgi:putative phosphoserine phosphatase/1-acylglycerol-3-phosphate O-acyltransferase